jgi:hypothetical protein
LMTGDESRARNSRLPMAKSRPYFRNGRQNKFVLKLSVPVWVVPM